MIRTRLLRFGAIASSLVLGAVLAMSPVIASSGNGKGHGQGGVNGGSSAGGNKSSGSQASAGSGGKALGQSKAGSGISANQLGKLNGFFSASETALRNAAPNSSIGKISIVYAGLLQSYLQSYLQSPTDGTTLLQLNEALLDAANKPLSAEIIQSINQRLFDTNTTLEEAMTTATANGSGLTPETLAASIFAPTAPTLY
jgi:hypothetical protein